LPVGTAGQHELFDVWLSRYVPVPKALEQLRAVSGDIPISELTYVDPRSKGLQASHVLESYELEVNSPDRAAEQIQQTYQQLLEAGVLETKRKGKPKSYDLGVVLASALDVQDIDASPGLYRLNLTLRATAQGSLRPELLVAQLLDQQGAITSVTRTGLAAEDQAS